MYPYIILVICMFFSRDVTNLQKKVKKEDNEGGIKNKKVLREYYVAKCVVEKK